MNISELLAACVKQHSSAAGITRERITHKNIRLNM